MMKKLCVVLVVLFFSASNVYAFGSSKFKDEVKKESGAVKLVREVVAGGYDVITTSELHKSLENGDDLLIVDTMPFEASYKKGHVPSAVQFLFPIPEMKTWDPKETGGKTAEDFEKMLGSDKNRKIVIYCGFVKCTRSHNGALWARKIGYTNVYRYPGGIYAWKGAGYKVDSLK